MMGEQLGRQERLFYAFCLADRLPPDHLLRRVDAVLDLYWLRDALALKRYTRFMLIGSRARNLALPLVTVIPPCMLGACSFDRV